MDHVFARLELHVVGDVNGRHQKTELQSEMAAKRANALQELPALRLVDQRHQRVADFEAEFIELEQALDLLLRVGLFVLLRADGLFRGFVAARTREARYAVMPASKKEREFRKSGN